MKSRTAAYFYLGAILVVTLTACTSANLSASPGGGSKTYFGSENRPVERYQYGTDTLVRTTISIVKSQGHQQRLSSRAIRLPERTLGEISAYEYAFAAACGAHQFRVYETDGTLILEYAATAAGSNAELIRDYVSGPSPFVQPGLWSAYDHTASSISGMTSAIEHGASGLVNGVYSKGLQTGLPIHEQRDLGIAYRQALADAMACQTF